MFVHTPEGEVNSFIFHTGSVVINESWSQYRYERLIAQAFLYCAVFDMKTSDVPLLASFDGIEFKERSLLILAIMQLVI